MDKNSIIGLVLIALLLIGYMFITKPSKEELAEMKRKQDSIARVKYEKDSIEKIQKEILAAREDSLKKLEAQTDTAALNEEISDSIKQLKLKSKYGIFSDAATGEEKFYKVENEKMIITFTNKGGKIYSVELKEYKTYYQEPLILFENDSNSIFGIELMVDGKGISTNELYFTPTVNSENIKVSGKEQRFSMRLAASEKQYIEFEYIIKPNDYMIDYDIKFIGLDKELENNPYINLLWKVKIPGLERGRDWESNNTTIYVKMSGENEFEYLSETKEKDSFQSRGSIQWVAYKQQFFSSILVAKDKLDNPKISLLKFKDNKSKYLKEFNSEFTLPLKKSDKQIYNFSFYFGPNKYSLLKSYGLKFEKLVPLGWGIFGWVNKFIVIPIFNWLGKFIDNFGIIILLLTLIIKIGLFPLTYKSYLSSAKMRVLKPQIDEITKKFPAGKEMEKQQAIMSFYKKAGVSPFGGCLPLLLQFPILIAMFRFFPASIELRQESFLWANDLSTYDAIVEWNTYIPILTNLYGNHISLFTLLMAISMLISTWMTSSNQPTNSNMPGMKTMMYIMPVMMIFWFNKYSSGLSYYYFLANLITILQTIIIQKFIIDEKKLLAEIEANKKKPAKPKSKWQQRLEEAQKMQQQRLKQQQKRK